MAAIAALELRVGRLERVAADQAQVASRELADEAHQALFPPTWPDGRPRKQRYPKCWHDLPVRDAVIARHRRMPLDQAVLEITCEFGEERAPSKSALHRIWKQLDLTRCES